MLQIDTLLYNILSNQLKMPHVYFIQPAELVGTDRYKIGMTTKSDLSRVRSYKNGTRYLCIMECENALETERKLISHFTDDFHLVAGKEYFQIKNESLALNLFFQIVYGTYPTQLNDLLEEEEKSFNIFDKNNPLTWDDGDEFFISNGSSRPESMHIDEAMNFIQNTVAYIVVDNQYGFFVFKRFKDDIYGNEMEYIFTLSLNTQYKYDWDIYNDINDTHYPEWVDERIDNRTFIMKNLDKITYNYDFASNHLIIPDNQKKIFQKMKYPHQIWFELISRCTKVQPYTLYYYKEYITWMAKFLPNVKTLSMDNLNKFIMTQSSDNDYNTTDHWYFSCYFATRTYD